MNVHELADGRVCGGCSDCLDEEDLSDAAVEGERWPGDLEAGRAMLPPPEPPPLAPGETATLIGTSVLGSSPKDDRIEDEAGLMRAFASLRRATRALAQNQRMQAPVLEEVRKELQALEEKCAQANAALEARAEHHRNRIEVYARTHRDELVQGKRKTRDFGIGSVSFRTTGGEYRWRKDMPAVTRENVLMAWALKEEADSGETLVKAKWSPDLDKIKRHLDALDRESLKETLADQSAPPGLEYVPEHEELSVKVEGDK